MLMDFRTTESGVLNATGSDRPSHDDDERGQLQNRPDMPSFEGLATENRTDGKDDA
jgi:hypothetical protein